MLFSRVRIDRNGFTLVELVIIIVVLGIIAVVGIPKIGGLIGASKTNGTKTEMNELKRAIIGSSQVVAGGTFASPGFEGDVGHPPERLQDLVNKPDSIATWDRVTELGWHGPYIDESDGQYLIDAWDSTYVYDAAARSITSIGSGTNLTLNF